MRRKLLYLEVVWVRYQFCQLNSLSRPSSSRSYTPTPATTYIHNLRTRVIFLIQHFPRALLCTHYPTVLTTPPFLPQYQIVTTTCNTRIYSIVQATRLSSNPTPFSVLRSPMKAECHAAKTTCAGLSLPPSLTNRQLSVRVVIMPCITRITPPSFYLSQILLSIPPCVSRT